MTTTDLQAQLEQLGCSLSEERFRALVADTNRVLHPGWTAEVTVCYPHEAHWLCSTVRKRADCDLLPDHLILRTLLDGPAAIQREDDQ